MINIGIIGCSSFARRSLLPAMIELSRLYHIVGIASRSPNKADVYAEDFRTRAFYSYDDLLNDDSLEALYIPLPIGLHAQWVDAALDRGLHVLVEKSLATNADVVRNLCKKAETKKCVLVENFQFRFHPQLAYIKNLLDSGELGELRCLRSSFGCPPFADPDNIRYNEVLGGGALLDMGAYPLKISQEFLGRDLAVVAATMNTDTHKGVDTWGGGYLRQQNGALFSEVAFGFDHHYQCSLELWGSKARLFTNRIFTAPPGYSPQIVLERAKGQQVVTLPPANHFCRMLEHFYGLVQGQGKMSNELQQNIRQAELIEQFKMRAHE